MRTPTLRRSSLRSSVAGVLVTSIHDHDFLLWGRPRVGVLWGRPRVGVLRPWLQLPGCSVGRLRVWHCARLVRGLLPLACLRQELRLLLVILVVILACLIVIVVRVSFIRHQVTIQHTVKLVPALRVAMENGVRTCVCAAVDRQLVATYTLAALARRVAQGRSRAR